MFSTLHAELRALCSAIRYMDLCSLHFPAPSASRLSNVYSYCGNIVYFQLGVTVVGKPKPKILNELGIKTQAIYTRKLAGGAVGDEEDEDYEYEDEIEEPISWSGLVKIDTLIYPTMKGTLDIDQKGTLYVLLGTLTLPDGTAEFKDEFDFVVSLYIRPF